MTIHNVQIEAHDRTERFALSDLPESQELQHASTTNLQLVGKCNHDLSSNLERAGPWDIWQSFWHECALFSNT